MYNKLLDKKAKLALIGLGYVGLPIALEFAKKISVIGFDINEERLAKMRKKIDPCNQLAAEFFNGGGHLNASGGEFFGTMEEAKAVFEKALEKYKSLLTAKS